MICAYCKGVHSYTSCELWRKYVSLIKSKSFFSESFASSSPGIFVGSQGYPDVNVGLLTPASETDSWLYESPRFWAENNFSIQQVIDLRTSLLNSKKRVCVKETNKLTETAQTIALAEKPVDLELYLKKTPTFNAKFNSFSAPLGFSGFLKKAIITSNPKIASKVDKVVNDELKASESVYLLYNHGFEESVMSKILSSGSIGDKKKIVPTKWSITAIDDIIGKRLIDEVKKFDGFSNYEFYYSSYLGNHYLILLMPSTWSFELLEIHLPTNNTSTDYELFDGRKTYASNCVGGYYTARLAVLEKLKNFKKQAKIIVIRFITNEYTLPLGVWVTREACRKSFNSKKISFNSKEQIISFVKNFSKTNFNYDLEKFFNASKILNENKQKKIMEY